MQLNLEQKKLIRSSAMGHSIIRGVAGSGKTTVAVHRISFLLDKYCYGASDKILMVTYNKSLTNYIMVRLIKMTNMDCLIKQNYRKT